MILQGGARGQEEEQGGIDSAEERLEGQYDRRRARPPPGRPAQPPARADSPRCRPVATPNRWRMVHGGPGQGRRQRGRGSRCERRGWGVAPAAGGAGGGELENAGTTV
jgi:hypothetical protein